MPRKINGNIGVVFVIGLMLILALMREVYFFPTMDMIPNPDSSWLIYAAGRMINGQKLYSEILETNPPLILWISMLPVYVGRLIGQPPLIVFPFLVSLLNIVSLSLVAIIVKKQKFLGQSPLYQAVLLYIAFGFFLLSPAMYGQRELLMVALVIPYLFYSLGEDDEKPKSFIKILIVIMAAIGFAIKPYFLLLWGLNELYLVIRKRSILSIFAWHNWVIGLTQVLYVASILNFYPDYIKTIVPLVFTTYFTYEAVWKTIAKLLTSIVGIIFLLFFMAKPHGEYRKIIIQALFWVVATAGFIALQRKDWPNHLYPLFFMSGFVVTMVLMCMHEIWQDIGLEIGHRRFIALCGSIAILLGCSWVDAKFWYFIYQHPSVIHGKLLTEINERADGKYVYPLTFNMQSAFPVIALSKGIFRGSFYQLWPMAGLIIREQENIKTPELTKAYTFFYDTLVHDFVDFPPEFVWVDENVNLAKIQEYDIEPENRDIIKVLTRDVRFAILWQNYEKVGEIIGAPPPKEDIVEGEPPLQPDRYSLYTRIKQVKEHNEQ